MCAIWRWDHTKTHFEHFNLFNFPFFSKKKWFNYFITIHTHCTFMWILKAPYSIKLPVCPLNEYILFIGLIVVCLFHGIFGIRSYGSALLFFIHSDLFQCNDRNYNLLVQLFTWETEQKKWKFEKRSKWTKIKK